MNDRGCCAVIAEDWSGYCECADGSKTMNKGCEKGGYVTCNEACQENIPCGKLYSRLIENIHIHNFIIWVKMSSMFTRNNHISEAPPTTEALVPRTSTDSGSFLSL